MEILSLTRDKQVWEYESMGVWELLVVCSDGHRSTVIGQLKALSPPK
jgi:hypothetical protein